MGETLIAALSEIFSMILPWEMVCPIMNRPSAAERDYTACLSVGFVMLKDPPKQPVAKVMQERKMGTATNSPPVMAQENKHLA